MIELQRVLDLLENPDRILITRRGEKICYGYKANICGAHGSRSHLPDYGLTGHEIVHKIRPHIEYRHPKWQEKGLDAPLMPQEAPDYIFRDLQGTFYFEIKI